MEANQGQFLNEVEGVGLLGCLLYLSHRDTLTTVGNVFGDGGSKQHRLLAHNPNVLTEVG